MFAPAYNYALQHQRTQSSPRERYVSALSRVQQAEMEYAAYLAQQERARLLQRQAEQQERVRLVQMQQQRARQQERIRLLQVQERNEQRRAAAVIILHAAVSSLLSGQSEQASHPGQALKPQVAKAAPAVECGAQLQRRNRVRVVRPQETPVDTPVSAVRTALKRRLASESNVDVHATIQSILSNLSLTPTPIAPAPVVSKSAAVVHKVASAFRTLASEFVFPAQPDFAPSASGGYVAAQLPYTPRNAPIRHYEHALNGLLAQLDAIDSEGDAAVRRQRKFVVGLVEKALEDLDKIVEGRWKLQDTRARTPDAAVASASNSNTEPAAAAAPLPSVDQASETQTPSTADVEPTPEPSQAFPPYERQDGASQGDSSVEIKEQEFEALRIQPSNLDVHEPAESDTLTNSQPGDSTGLPELELSPAAEPEIESDSQLAATEEGSDFPALESPVDDESMTESVKPTVSVSSPKSLSLEIPIPDEDLVVVDLEEKADSDSSYSVSSYSDSEWTE